MCMYVYAVYILDVLTRVMHTLWVCLLSMCESVCCRLFMYGVRTCVCMSTYVCACVVHIENKFYTLYECYHKQCTLYNVQCKLENVQTVV